MPTELTNQFTVITLHPERDIEISGMDLRDQNNLPSCYNKTKRSIKKAWAALEKGWTDQTTMHEACTILSQNGIKMHTYCAMD